MDKKIHSQITNTQTLNIEREYQSSEQKLNRQQHDIQMSRKMIQEKRINMNIYEDLAAYSEQLIYVMLITTFFTVMCSLLPNYLMLIAVVVHLLDFFIVSTIILITSNILQSIFKMKRRRIIKSYWHYLAYIGIYKYISIINNNTRYLYTTPSHTYIPNPLYKHHVQHIIYSLIFYFSYIYSTGHTNLTTNKYVFILLLFVSSQLFFGMLSQSQVLCVFGYVVIVAGYRFGWSDKESYDLGIFRVLLKKDVKYQSHQKQTMDIILKRAIDKICTHPLVKSPQQKTKLHRIIWLIVSIVYFISSVTKQCRQYWHWMLIWIASIVLGKAKQLQLQYVKSRYKNILWAALVAYVGQSLYFVLFQEYSNSQQCDYVGDVLNFHIANLICLIIIGYYVLLEQHTAYNKNNAFLQSSVSIFIIQPLKPTNYPIIAQNPDKPYTISLLLLKHTLLVLTILELIITYWIYSYKYHYHSIKSTHIQQQPHLLSYNYGDDDNYSIYENACFGYIVLGFWGVCSYLIYRMGVFSAVHTSLQEGVRNDVEYGYCYSHGYRKILINTLIVSLILTFINITSEFNQITGLITQKVKHLVLLHPKCPRLQQYYKTSTHLHNCHSILETTPIILTILCILTSVYWIIKQKTKTIKIRNNTHLSMFISVLYWTCIIIYCGVVGYGLLNWECFCLGYWICLYILAMVFTIINLIYKDLSSFKQKQF